MDFSLTEEQELIVSKSYDIKEKPALINAGSNKALNYRTAQDLFIENLKECCT